MRVGSSPSKTSQSNRAIWERVVLRAENINSVFSSDNEMWVACKSRRLSLEREEK